MTTISSQLSMNGFSRSSIVLDNAPLIFFMLTFARFYLFVLKYT